jgi:hypothetical protein
VLCLSSYGSGKSQPKYFVPIGRIQNLNGTILDKMIFRSARENINKCGLGKLASAEMGKTRFLATTEPCQMVGDKDQVSCRPATMLLAAYDGCPSSWN